MADLDVADPIAAIASPPGASERGIIRLSGANAVEIAARCFTPDEPSAVLTSIRVPQGVPGSATGTSVCIPIPCRLLVWPTARSYTGQPMVEFHLIGSPPLMDAVLETLFASGARGANRGEFTLRSFLAGRIDLLQAEGVLGVIDASDHQELETALTQLGGGVSAELANVRSELVSLLGDLEAGLDFVEEDIQFISRSQICKRLGICDAVVRGLIESSADRMPSGYDPRVVLAGLPNAGKSTLFNELLPEGKAIVSSVPGTTRDYLTGRLTVGGMTVQLIDTAGWEAASSVIMSQAQLSRNDQMQSGDLVLWCNSLCATSREQSDNARIRDQAARAQASVIDVWTQADRQTMNLPSETPGVKVSATTGAGLNELTARIEEHFSQANSSRGMLLSSTTARCKESLQATSGAIVQAVAAARSDLGDEVVAIELRDALQRIGIILGEVYTDDILDHIFSNFCIGK